MLGKAADAGLAAANANLAPVATEAGASLGKVVGEKYDAAVDAAERPTAEQERERMETVGEHAVAHGGNFFLRALAMST